MRRLLFGLVALALLLAAGVASAGAALASPGNGSASITGTGRTVSGRPVIDSISPVAGPVAGGTSVTVDGAGFQRAEWVRLGGVVTHSLRIRSSTVLVFVTPRHAAGSLAITIGGASGTSKPSAARFHYVIRPSITAMSAHSGPVTGDQLITITGKALSYVRSVHFGKLAARVAGGTGTRLRVRTPASWAGRVVVTVTTAGGTSPGTAASRFTFSNPPPVSTASLTAASGAVVAAASDVSAVTGGLATTTGDGVSQTPWQVTLAAGATVPAAGQDYVLEPGGSVYPSGLAGTVTAVDTAATPATITVAAPASLASTMQAAQADFSGLIGDGAVPANGSQRPVVMRAARSPAAAQDLLGTIDFGSIPASALQCGGSDAASVGLSGSLSLTLTDVEAHVQVALGSLLSSPSADVWISYQPTISANLTATAELQCSLPASWQNTHQALFVLGDTGISVAIAPAASFTVSAAGTIKVSQHSYRMLGFVTNPGGSVRRIDSSSSDPAQASASAALSVDAAAGVQVQIGELDVIGVGMTLQGGIKGSAAEPWPPQLCLGVTPYLSGSLYAFLNAWITEWQLTGFQTELDLSPITACIGTGWHTAWRSSDASLYSVACPSNAECIAVGGLSGHGYIVRTTDGGQTWSTATIGAAGSFARVACVNGSDCIASGDGSKVAVTDDAGASWSEVSLPYEYSPLVSVWSDACLADGTCYVTAFMTKYSGALVYGSSDAGRKWTFDGVVDDEPDTMTCLSMSSCVAVGSTPVTEGIVFPAASDATVDGWASSYTGKFPANALEPNSVSCMSASLCYAAGFGLVETTNFGKTWRAASVGLPQAEAVSCASSTVCVGGSGSGPAQFVVYTTDGGHDWNKTTISTFPASDDTSVVGLACPSPGHCTAIEAGTGPTVLVVS